MRKHAYALTVAAAAVLVLLSAAPAFAQDTNGAVDDREIIVTARRVEERLQDVPASITVYNQEQLSNLNVSSGSDLATYTPSLSTNDRFGPDNSGFAIRGFTQELRTTASVGVYFADVVAQRGGQNSVTNGDGAGPGAFFDLQNVQVLKGPQGTLFGRNTTGGAVILVPQRPTDVFEGYFEGTVGDFNQRRAQGVVNLPLSERARLRLGADYQTRDGYLNNISGSGPEELSDIDYWSGRASLVFDVTPTIDNYTILTYANSDNSGSVAPMFACAPDPTFRLAAFCQQQLAEQAAAGQTGFYDVASTVSDPESHIEQWQLINTTTWAVNDNFTIKNIIAYGEIESTLRSALFGTNFHIPNAVPGIGGLPFVFATSDQVDGFPTAQQSNLVEELQFSGRSFGGRLTWQGGLYYEHSDPQGLAGSMGEGNIYCLEHPGSPDPTNHQCQDVLRQLAIISSGGAVDPGPSASVGRQLGEIEFTNQAIYAQGTYEFNEQWRLNLGARYTWDETDSRASHVVFRGYPTAAPGAPDPALTICAVTSAVLPDCWVNQHQESDAPTWLIGLDYNPTEDVLIYAKYARGYRQGSVNLFGAQGFQTYDPEEVDAYEVGLKSSFDAPIRGTFNIAAFYNELRDQQIQVGFFSTIVTPTTGIVNAGESTIQGVEVEASIWATENLRFDLSYTYLDTELKELVLPTLPPGSVFSTIVPSAVPGSDLTLSPPHKLQLTATYDLPVPENFGDVSVAGTYVFTDEQLTSAGSPFGTLPSYEIFNLNLNWDNVGRGPVDAALFVTNLFDEEYPVYVPGLFTSIGAEFRNVGVPRMMGVRVRYNFGG